MATEQQFGDLILTFTTSFTLRYNDKNSGASQDGAFWQPNCPAGFFPLGGVGVGNYNDINGTSWALCVKDGSKNQDALKHPEDYTQIWNDKKSGASMDGACWRAKAPKGYVALGDIFGKGYDKPALTDMVCVRADLIEEGAIGNQIWSDKNSGASMDIDTYEIVVPDGTNLSETNGLFAANTFVANNAYGKPTGAPVINCLNLPFPVVVNPDPAVPTLNSTNMPPSTTGKTIDRIVTVPFTCLNDNKKSVAWKVQYSPFYTVERVIYYELELFDYNQTKVDQTVSKTVTTGVSKSQTDTFSVTTGISVTAKGGVSFLGTGGEVSATVSVELGWESSTGIEQFVEDSVQRSMVTQPATAGALWALAYTLMAVRADKTVLGDLLSFDVDSFVHAQYPNTPGEKRSVVYPPIKEAVEA